MSCYSAAMFKASVEALMPSSVRPAPYQQSERCKCQRLRGLAFNSRYKPQNGPLQSPAPSALCQLPRWVVVFSRRQPDQGNGAQFICAKR